MYCFLYSGRRDAPPSVEQSHLSTPGSCWSEYGSILTVNLQYLYLNLKRQMSSYMLKASSGLVETQAVIKIKNQALPRRLAYVVPDICRQSRVLESHIAVY